MAGRTYDKELRVRRRREYLAVQQAGTRFHTGHLIVLIRSNDRPHARLGVTVSRKVGGSVVRNRIKRYLREIFRHNREWFPAAHDVVLIAKKHASKAGYSQLLDELGVARRRWRALGGSA